MWVRGRNDCGLGGFLLICVQVAVFVKVPTTTLVASSFVLRLCFDQSVCVFMLCINLPKSPYNHPNMWSVSSSYTLMQEINLFGFWRINYAHNSRYTYEKQCSGSVYCASGGEVYTRQSGIWLNYVYWSEVELFDVLEWEQ